ncbi:MAG TPA: TlpA disulfide reductase family protein [Flavobacteriaceae bacterium]
MRPLFILFFTIVFVSCNKDPKIDYALLSGKAENTTSNTVVIEKGDFNKEIPIETDGTFADTLKLTEAGFYTLSIGREQTSVYLKNGFDIHFTIDTNQFDETISYTGTGASENNYLAAKQLNIEKYTANPQEFYSLDEAAFKIRVDSLKAGNASLLTGLSDADTDFITYETQNLEYDAYALLNRYENNHGYYAKVEDFKISEEFLPEALKNLTYDDAEAYNRSSSYKSMAFSTVLDKLFGTIGDDYLSATPENLKDISNLKIPALKNEIVGYLGSFLVSPGNPNMKRVYEFFLANTTDEKIKTKLNEVYEKGKDLVRGNPSPQFTNYENHKGGTMSLSDLKGKYVYIDVWATWCGPCKREIPSLKEVEKQFHGKNIAFVSTSIDVANDHDKWFAMVNEMSLGGTQLFADNDWKSQFVVDYAIEGIPRFILVDPDGNIVSADAPRPSNPKLVELFISLKI